MRYGLIPLALLCLYASNSFAALEVITSSEENTLSEIESQYDIDPMLIAVNDKFSRHNKKAYDIEELQDSIASEKDHYQSLLSQLQAKILSQSTMAPFYHQVETVVKNIDSLEKRSQTETAALKKEIMDIHSEYDAINQQRADKSQKLFKLKTSITDRLIADLSKPSSQLPITIDGSTECSKYQSISDCLKESKNFILTNTRNDSPFLNNKSVLLSYEVVDASMNMHGNLHYKVAMNFKPSYNKKIDAILAEKLGLKSAMITLVSNVAADWYINGTKIGTGKKLFHEIPLGKHGILASYQSKDKSSVETIEGNGVFNYNFNVPVASKNSVELLPETTKNTNKTSSSTAIKPKAKYTLFSDQTSTKTTQAVNKTKNNSGYEYFMGVKPETKKQQVQFSHKPATN
ncbi:hypothetical protein G3R48_00655 [Shewanella intestini]|uniref:Uncharacterized protein n=1 Tax=Shewanella intestini TaxID=2017544 RepID=A0ABS5HXM7_9GAMM|nr:hypothetical protein [Shewanella intestini]MRG34930.1 hypothetical protein [Shewanella sp. XMDDZSB0408]